MLICKNERPIINFIHIPRTGGRYVLDFLVHNNYELYLGENNKFFFTNVIDGVEVMHFHASLLEKYFFKYSSNSFTIVRDPIDRFKSGFPTLYKFSEEIGMKNLIFTSEIDKILTLSQKIYHNWFRPQNEFILDQTHIWKYENGLGSKFNNWLNNTVGLPLNKNKLPPYKNKKEIKNHYSFSKETIIEIEKTFPINNEKNYPFPEEMILAIKNFYSKDYELISTL